MGIYDSDLSVWERNQRGLPNDHAGEGVIDENKTKEIEELVKQIQSDNIPTPDMPNVETNGKIKLKHHKK